MVQIRKLSWIIVVAFAVRIAARWYSGGTDFWTNGYSFFFALAQNIASGQGIALNGQATAFRVPLYPMFLAAVTFGRKEFISVVLFQSLIGAATVCCAALIAREMFGYRAALMAALVTALYPYYVIHDTALQETGLYTFLTALAVLLVMRARRGGSRSMAAVAGLVLGADVLTRANLAPFALLVPLILLVPIQPGSTSWQRRAWACALCAGAVILMLTPWLLRSYALTGAPSLSTQSGFFLWLGNNASTFSRYPTESVDLSQRVALASLTTEQRAEMAALSPNEAAVDRWFLHEGLDYMRDHPWQTVVAAVRKIAAGFCLLPSPRRGFWPNLVYLLSYGPVMILGLGGMWMFRRSWRDHLIFYALFGCFAAVTAIYFGHTSYRVYLDVYWIVFAAGLLDYLWTRRPLPTPVKLLDQFAVAA
jgi:4-amino-4-deoxy-L-arabinose transferase-like glycosyltransferase